MGLGLTSCVSGSGEAVELKGRIAMKGSTPNTYLVIEDEGTGKDYQITNPSAFGLSKKQNSIVNIKASLTKDEIGPGFPAQIEVTEVNN